MRFILVFDTYKADSLKQKTRERDPIQYQIADDTNIKHVPNGTLPISRKADLTEYFVHKQYSRITQTPKRYSSHQHQAVQEATNRDMQFEENDHEEADTLMICFAAAAPQSCPEGQMVFFSPGTDVLVLAVAHYNKLCKHTAICTGILHLGYS